MNDWNPGFKTQRDDVTWAYPDWATRKVPGKVYRGVTSQEYASIMEKGYIQSTNAHSLTGQGTSFAPTADMALSYAHVGRDNPARTGKPVYVVEVERTTDHIDVPRLDEIESHKPIDVRYVTRSWRFNPDGSVDTMPRPRKAARYPGNLGMEELSVFYDKATAVQQTLLDRLLDSEKWEQAWQFIQKVTGMKLEPLQPAYARVAAMQRRADLVVRTTSFRGLEIHLDRPAGFVQKLATPEGEKTRTYTADYGFFPGTRDADNEELDVFLGPVASADSVFVVKQNKHDGSFDEHKVMLGFDSASDAIRTYGEHIPMSLIAEVEEMPFEAFKTAFLDTSVTKLARRYMTASLRVAAPKKTAPVKPKSDIEKALLPLVAEPEDADGAEREYGRMVEHILRQKWKEVWAKLEPIEKKGADEYENGFTLSDGSYYYVIKFPETVVVSGLVKFVLASFTEDVLKELSSDLKPGAKPTPELIEATGKIMERALAEVVSENEWLHPKVVENTEQWMFDTSAVNVDVTTRDEDGNEALGSDHPSIVWDLKIQPSEFRVQLTPSVFACRVRIPLRVKIHKITTPYDHGYSRYGASKKPKSDIEIAHKALKDVAARKGDKGTVSVRDVANALWADHGVLKEDDDVGNEGNWRGFLHPEAKAALLALKARGIADEILTPAGRGNGRWKLKKASLAARLADMHLAKVFPSQEAMTQYMKDHPQADRTNHSVKAPDAKKGPAKDEDKADKKEKDEPEGKSKAPKAPAKPKSAVKWDTVKTTPMPRKNGKPGGPAGGQLSKDMLEKLKKLGVSKLPAAHIADIYVSDMDDPHGGALLRWIDDKGKEQRTYSAEFDRRNAEQKWKRVLTNRPKVKAALNDLESKAAGSPAHAAVLLIAETGLRPGSEGSVEKHKHYGVTTMEARHLTFEGDEARIEYVGKEGVTNKATVTNPKLVEALKKMTKGKKPNDPVFEASRSEIAEASPKGVKLKDFRTTLATNYAEELLKGTKVEMTGNEKKDARAVIAALKAVSTSVSHKLNNTPAMARRSYIAPQIIKAWGEKNGVKAEWLE